MQCTHLITDLTDLVFFLSLEVSKHVLDVSTHTHTRAHEYLAVLFICLLLTTY